jgi:hypothetical protein
VTFLTRLAPVLTRVGKMVRVMGHTDARKYVSGKKSNWDLSFERASAAHKVLASNGMAEQIESVTAFGATRLRNTENPIAAENRRLGLLVLSPGSPTVFRCRVIRIRRRSRVRLPVRHRPRLCRKQRRLWHRRLLHPRNLQRSRGCEAHGHVPMI